MSLESARKSFANKQYKDAMNESMAVITSYMDRLKEGESNAAIKESDELKEAFVIYIKSQISSDIIIIFDDSKGEELLAKSISVFSGTFNSVKESFDYELEIRKYLSDWINEYYDGKFAAVERNPSMQAYKAAIKGNDKLVGCGITMIPAFRGHLNELCEKEGITREEAFEKYGDPSDQVETIVSPEKHITKHAINIIENSIRVFNRESPGASAEYAKNVALNYLKDIDTGLVMLTYGIHSDKSKLNDDDYPLLEKYIRYSTIALNSTIMINGRRIYIFMSPDRSYNYSTLVKYREWYLEHNPGADLPPLPIEQTPAVPPASSGGCYVATAVYGSYDCPQVWTLRRYRDYSLAQTWYGRVFIRTYYAISPTLVKWFGDTYWFKKLWRGILDKKITRLNANGVENTPYTDKEW